MSIETRPYPNYHAARVRDPSDFDHIATLSTTKEGILVLGGPLKSDPKGGAEVQAYRFPKDKFTVAEAKAWLKEHNVKYTEFEPAGEKSADDTVERRVVLSCAVEAREDAPIAGSEASTAKHLIGYAALFNVRATIWDGLDEQIAPGAFSDSLQNPADDVCALFNHDANWPLGRRSAGTLTVTEDDKGLLYDIMLPDTQRCNDLWQSVKRGDVKGSSFGFCCLDDEYDKSDATSVLRTIRKAVLVDVSPCTFPAYKTTTVSARAQSEFRKHFDCDAPAAKAPNMRRLTEGRSDIVAGEAGIT